VSAARAIERFGDIAAHPILLHRRFVALFRQIIS
jgi:hypothetical protein